MHACDLSVSELARITGLAIDERWAYAAIGAAATRTTVWCAPEWDARSLLNAAPSGLPPAGAVRMEERSGSASWGADWPLALDLHWLREITPGFPLGVRPVRVHSPLRLKTAVHLQGDFTTLVWRSRTGESRAQIALDLERRAPAIVLEDTAQSALKKPLGMDELLRALTGSTSMEWLRSVFADSCSLRWKQLARQIGARVDQLDDLGVYFRALTTTEEDVLWRVATSMASLSELKPWAEALGVGQPSACEELLHGELRRVGPFFWRTPAGEWLNAIAGGTLVRLTSEEIAPRLAVSAGKLRSLLIREDLANMLVRLHTLADAEWAVVAPWYRSRIEESCGKLSVDPGPRRVVDEVSLWLKKLQTRLHRRCLETARLSVQEALTAAVLKPDTYGGKSSLLADLSSASSHGNDALLARIFSGDLRRCLDATVQRSSGARSPVGLLNGLQSRRIVIQVSIPLLQKKAWATAREDLATAEIRETGAGRLTVAGSAGTGSDCVARESTAMLLSAVFTSRVEAPADDMLRMSHETRRTLLGNEADVTWLRLVRAYGLTVPVGQSTPCVATLRAEMPWNWAEAWSDPPAKHDRGELERSVQLSVAMQELARHWLPALHLSTARQFEAPGAVLPLLVYAASQPQASRKKAEFGYDPMSPHRVERAAASSIDRLPELLDSIHTCLKASGRSDIAEYYLPDRARSIISDVQRRPHPFAALLAGDVFLFEHCLQFMTVCRELRALTGRNPAQALRKLAQAAEEMVKTSQRGMRRYYPDRTHQGLGTVYLLEATRVLAECTGRGIFRASLSIESGVGVRGLDAAA